MVINKKWVTTLPEENISAQLIERYQLTPLVKTVLESRGITSAEALEELLTDQPLHDPFLMHDMDKAVKRIRQAVEQGEPILVYGDYDADGVTSVTVLMAALNELGAAADFYIPNRFTEGYGPNEAAFRFAAEEGVGLIITVDNGVKGHHEVEVANALGLDVILTDHHEIGETLPDAYAVIHPAHPDGTYPCPHLAGVGVSFKLATALLGRVENQLLGFAAIGTVSDLVPLTGENRTIVKQGLVQLNQSQPPGIKALLHQAGHQGEITEETIGFRIGPRLNAVGRLDDARPAAELLMETDDGEAEWLAEQVDQFNVERKAVVDDIAAHALQQAEAKVSAGLKFLVITGEDWNEGVLGIVASKIVEQYTLPTIVLNMNTDEGYAKGSARSIPQVSMYDYLDRQNALLSRFGGHHMAAGLTMPIDHVEQLEAALNDELDTYLLDHELEAVVYIDGDIAIDDITAAHIYQLEKLRPFGTDNPAPLFSVSNTEISQIKAIGQQGRHLKVMLDAQLNALKWSAGHLAAEYPEGTHVNVCGRLQLNEWNGHVTPQLLIEDIKSDDIRFIDFRNQHPSKFAFLKDEDVIYLINQDKTKNADNYYFYGDNISGHDKIVLRDLPHDLEAFDQSMQSSTARQIFVIFHIGQQVYFEGMPGLDKFRQLYKLLHAGPVKLVNDGMRLTEQLNIKPNTLIFMINVLAELGIVQLEGDSYTLNKASGKVEIPSSALYQTRDAQLKREQQLLYSSFETIKQHIKDKMY